MQTLQKGAVHVIEFAREHHVTLVAPREAGSRVTCLAFSTNGSRLAAAEEIGTIRIWILDQIINSTGFQPAPPVSKFNVGRDIFVIAFLNGCGSLITGTGFYFYQNQNLNFFILIF